MYYNAQEYRALRATPNFEVRDSTIPNAGKGLFTSERLYTFKTEVGRPLDPELHRPFVRKGAAARIHRVSSEKDLQLYRLQTRNTNTVKKYTLCCDICHWSEDGTSIAPVSHVIVQQGAAKPQLCRVFYDGTPTQTFDPDLVRVELRDGTRLALDFTHEGWYQNQQRAARGDAYLPGLGTWVACEEAVEEMRANDPQADRAHPFDAEYNAEFVPVLTQTAGGRWAATNMALRLLRDVPPGGEIFVNYGWTKQGNRNGFSRSARRGASRRPPLRSSPTCTSSRSCQIDENGGDVSGEGEQLAQRKLWPRLRVRVGVQGHRVPMQTHPQQWVSPGPCGAVRVKTSRTRAATSARPSGACPGHPLRSGGSLAARACVAGSRQNQAEHARDGGAEQVGAGAVDDLTTTRRNESCTGSPQVKRGPEKRKRMRRRRSRPTRTPPLTPSSAGVPGPLQGHDLAPPPKSPRRVALAQRNAHFEPGAWRLDEPDGGDVVPDAAAIEMCDHVALLEVADGPSPACSPRTTPHLWLLKVMPAGRSGASCSVRVGGGTLASVLTTHWRHNAHSICWDSHRSRHAAQKRWPHG